MKIEIEYCDQWNYGPEAGRVSAEIEGVTQARVQLIASSGGIFEIRKDGELLWKKPRGGAFPTGEEARALFVSEL